jgi:AraC family transcriptional regulator
MPVSSALLSNRSAARNRSPFSEREAWAGVPAGWQHLHGSFRDLGYSLEWHDFTAKGDLDWARSFHPDGVEICLNLAGQGTVQAGGARLELAPQTAGFYLQSEPQLVATRAGGERHQFVTVELSFAFLARHLVSAEDGMNSRLKSVMKGKPAAQVSEAFRLTTEHQQLIMSLRRPPVYAGAQRLWYHAKALEVASAFFFQSSGDNVLFCQRQKRQNQERVQKVVAILRQDLAETLSLEEIGRRVGCSHFHLSRVFAQETGKSIFQCLRELRMERAAELLREGRLNVTQVALEVGYSSPSHFSVAFHGAFGCCPGLYPLATQTQRAGK